MSIYFKAGEYVEYVLGFDGGGTKTELMVTDLAGTELASFIGGASNPKSVPFDEVIRHLKELLNRLHRQPEYPPELCRGICLGIAGIYTEEEKHRVHEQLTGYYANLGWAAPAIAITSDAEIALMAALGEPKGIIVIAGTGSIVYGFTPNGHRYRAGGWGHLLGDQGSGYDIGLKTLQSVMLSYDGVLQPTLLTELVLEAYGFSSPPELRSYIYEPHIDKQHVAKFAELCIRAAEAGDKTALDIIDKAAADLAGLTEAMLRRDDAFSQLSIAVTGSIFQYSTRFAEQFRSRLGRLADASRIISAEKRPAYGAALLAAREWNKGKLK